MKGKITDTPNLNDAIYFTLKSIDRAIGTPWELGKGAAVEAQKELDVLVAAYNQQTARIAGLEAELAAINEAERKRNAGLAFLLGE